MAKGHTPRHGSMGYYPRKRARSIVARIRRWPDIGEVKPLGFAGYKVGTLHVIKMEDNPNSPFYGQEVATVATVIETPPIIVAGVRVYKETVYGLKTLGEVWAKETPKDLARVFTVPKKDNLYEVQLRKINSLKEKVDKVRLLSVMQPRLAGIHKKKPELFEIEIGGDPSKAFEYALDLLGKSIEVSSVFSEGDIIDVISVTKGKGYAGVIKRFGVKELPRWHKHRKGSRRIGSVSPQNPSIMRMVPFAGQLGFHQRTEYHKRILKIGSVNLEKGEDDINPSGGWPHYGLVKSQYILVEGTVPGAIKRLVKMRFTIRPVKIQLEKPRIVYVSTKPVG